ncbi:MAG: 2,3,4,5-tetrahydropyridine-2,6-dicarboxylate N-succinyltransferase [Actinobacteria bacterium]|nr:2,3,4,5-tetrahydropyridine-2,6-dicarboxylate N-succinyltransferase [Actinomycetota bacterium]
MSHNAWGVGIATLDATGATLDVRFRTIGLGDFSPADAPTYEPSVDSDRDRGVVFHAVAITIDTNEAPASAADVYLRLNLLSQRFMQPRTINLDGAFGLLQNVAWTSKGPVPIDAIESVTWNFAQRGEHIVVHGVDKFPRMTDYVVPSGVRIADASRVRLGAHLAPGTTVMHEGFCNFNAGTLGASMVEGRISAGVIVGDGSDIGGGASIMGTLSGGGKEMVTIGERCLLGANAGIGISLGDDCIVEAGLYVTAGTVVIDPSGNAVKAKLLSGQSNLLFRRNSISGSVEVISRSGSWGGLNADLHKN